MRVLPWFLLLCACGSTIERRWQADDFQSDALHDGRLLVAAVVAVEDLHREGHSSERAYTQRLHERLEKTRDDIPMAPHTAFIDRLDFERIDALLARYRDRGSLGPESLPHLEALQIEARYVAFCRVEEDRVRREAGDSPELGTPQEGQELSTNYQTKRTLVASFDIFDTRDARLVWTARFTKEGKEGRSRTYGRRNPDTREIDPSFSWANSGGFPDAPEFLDLLDSMFEDFGKALP